MLQCIQLYAHSVREKNAGAKVLLFSHIGKFLLKFLQFFPIVSKMILKFNFSPSPTLFLCNVLNIQRLTLCR